MASANILNYIFTFSQVTEINSNMLHKTAIATLASLALTANAQDPAEGWMAYAVGVIPQSADRVTKLEMQWKVRWRFFACPPI
jgi:hypothetical protein